jgi:hypothetical protein
MMSEITKVLVSAGNRSVGEILTAYNRDVRDASKVSEAGERVVSSSDRAKLADQVLARIDAVNGDF